MGPELDDSGSILDGVKVPWAPGAAFSTPPGPTLHWHSIGFGCTLQAASTRAQPGCLHVFLSHLAPHKAVRSIILLPWFSGCRLREVAS